MAQSYGALSGAYSSPPSDSAQSNSRSPSPASLPLNGSAGVDRAPDASDRLLQSSRLAGSSSLWRSSRALLPTQGGARAPLRKTRSIVVLGFSMVGKTALCVRFVNDRFEEAYEPTYENSFVKLLHHRGQEIECVIKDTQGVGEQETFRNEYGLGVHGYVLVYSIASARSFAIVQNINEKLCNLVGTRSVPRVLIGNKFDLLTSPSSASSSAAGAAGAALAASSQVRQVSVEQGQALADQWGCPFFECSARGGVNIERAFSALLDQIDAINEPQHTRDMDRWWRSLFCCRWLRRRWGGSSSGEEDDESLGGVSRPDSSLLSSADLAHSVARYTNVCKATGWSVMLLSLMGVIYGAVLAVHTTPRTDNDDSQAELVGYILFAMAMLVWLVSLVGLYALRAPAGAVEFLSVYTCSLALLVVAEVAVWVALLLAHVDIVAGHVIAAALVGGITVALQLASASGAYKLAKALNATAAAAASPYGDDYLATYHSLYE